jgi:hypothetical protein
VLSAASSSESEKFDFRSQPFAEVLSVWLRMQSSGLISRLNMSTQIVMTQAMNSKEFSEVRSRQSTGSSNLQADPEVNLYPPNPNSDASDLYIFDGFLNTILLIVRI